MAADRVQRCLRPPTRSASVREVLAAAVEALGGQERPGQIAMAEAVGDALTDHRHLVVQAGTGTGKSLAYLVPALLHDRRVVVATATLALQHQLVERDIPRLVEAVGATHPEVDASYAVLKGRSNYACLHRIREGVPDEQGALIEVPEGSLGKKVLELRSWAEKEAESEGSGERDHAPRHTDREWRQVSVSHRDCLGAARCPFGEECFVEQAREKAHRSHLIVTNHSLLAIDAIEGVPMIPDYDVVVVDEAHEVVSRVTQAATDELFSAEVDRAARRSRRWVSRARRSRRRPTTSPTPATPCPRRSASASRAASTRSPRRWPTRWCWCATPRGPACRRTPRRATAPRPDAGRTQARGAVQEVFATAERMAAGSEADVLWLTEGGEPPAAEAVRRAARGLGSDARQAPHRQDRGHDLGDPDARRRLQRARHVGRAEAGRARRRRGRRDRAVGRPLLVGRAPRTRAERAPGTTLSRPRRPRPCRGWASTSGRRSTTDGRRSSTSRATCRRRAATAWAPPSSTRSSRWSTRPRAARSGSSAPGAPPRPQPRWSASGCPT